MTSLILLGLAAAFTLFGIGFGLATRVFVEGPSGIIFVIGIVGTAALGSLIVRRHPRHVVGWILIAGGLTSGISVTSFVYSKYALTIRAGALPGGVVSAWVGDLIWLPTLSLGTTFLFLFFPDGRLPSVRWVPVVWLSLAASVLTELPTLFEKTLYEYPKIKAPLGSAPIPESVIDVVGGAIGFGLWFLAVLLALLSLIVRYRRARGEQRQQIRWVMYAAAVTIAIEVPFIVVEPGETGIWGILSSLAVLLVPVAVAVAILRYRLYDIDVVINKTVVYGALAGFITLVYVGVVVGIGALVGAGDKPNLGLSLAATAIVAIAFQPVRERVQSFANRLVYGQRVTPYEAITSFSNRMAESLSFREVLPNMAEAAARGVGGVRSQVRLFLSNGAIEEVRWPEGSGDDRFDQTLRVSHRGEELGEIAVAKAPGEPISTAEEKLLQDLASQAGLAMRNLRLTSELQQRLVDLQQSRKRIVAAQDTERRRMERDIHDGAQQHLVSLAVKLALAKSLLTTDPTRATETLDEINAETHEVVESIRDLARGIFPPLLADQGLGPALAAHLQKMSIDATLNDETTGARFSQEIEAAAYFTIREALQNAAKHSRGRIAITLEVADDNLSFRIEDEGPGFDVGKVKTGSGLENMRDRIDAVGGELKITSSHGGGTTIEGSIPVRALEPVG